MVHVIDLKFKGYEKAIAAFLIPTDAGLVLIETGPYSTFPNLTAGIEAAGYSADDVKHVLLTHIHLDHAGAAWAFAERNATIHVHPFGARHMADPSRLMDSARRIYKDEMDSLWGDMRAIPENRLRTAEDGYSLSVGGKNFTALYTPGHAVHHNAWKVDDVIFTGDVAGVKIANGMIVPPCPPPDINIEDWEASIDLLRNQNASRFFLTHFGEVTDVDVHLDTLKSILWDWANWMKPHWESGADPKELTPKFQDYTKQQLIDFGVAAEDLARYEAANPSWMSVAGLLRYWRKKAERLDA